MIHAKKVLPKYFEALLAGNKTFELRKEDPTEAEYAVGDYLAVNEYAPAQHSSETERYTGRCLLYEITYVLRNNELLADNVVALGLRLKPLTFDDVRRQVKAVNPANTLRV